MQNAKYCTNLISIFDVFSPANTNFFLPFELLTNKGICEQYACIHHFNLSISITQITIICSFLANIFKVLFPHLNIEMGLCYTSQHNFELFRLNSELKKLPSYFTFIQSCCSSALRCLFLTGLRELLTFIFQS